MAKKSKMIKLIALIILLLASLFAYAIVGKINKDKEEKEKESEESSSITVGATETDKITAFSYLYNGVEYQFQKESDIWHCTNDTSIELDPNLMNNLLDNFSKVTASRMVEESATDLSQYGLNQPYNEIKVTDVDGNTIVYQIGNQNQTVKSYYMKIDSSNTVYLIEKFPDNFKKTPEDLKKVVDTSKTDNSATTDSKTPENASDEIQSTDTNTQD